jgi:hypothetical protein
MRLLAAALLGLVAAGPAAAGLDDFARCLGRAGARYYRASWCPHCAAQERLFGTAARWLPAVDCSAPGSPACVQAGVRSFPTWTFAHGARLMRAASLEELAQRTDCRLDASRAEPKGATSAAVGGMPVRQRSVGGATIIELPR